MWVGELLDADHNVYHTYYLRGPSIKIGRSAENSLVFSSDKSISRVHAEVLVDSALSLRIVDCASRYGSSMGGAKLVANSPTKIEHGSIARFGVGNIRIRFLRKQYSFCPTRLEKPEKDRLKRLAKLLGARVVSQAEQATHVVANKCAATVKMLTAIVVPLKLVTVDWLRFAESSKVAEPVPPEEKFAPSPTHDVVVREPTRSRCSLLASHTVFLTQASDHQYANVLTSCGATVVSTYVQEEEKCEVNTTEAIATHMTSAAASASSNSSILYCLFFDESRGQDCEKGLIDRIMSLQPALEVRWLTAGQLAASVINLTAPVLTSDAPKASRFPGAGASFCSQSQYSAAPSQQLQIAPVLWPYPPSSSTLVAVSRQQTSTEADKGSATTGVALASTVTVSRAETREVSVKEEQRPAESAHTGKRAAVAEPGQELSCVKPPASSAAALTVPARLSCNIKLASVAGSCSSNSSSSGVAELSGKKRDISSAPVHAWDEPDACPSNAGSAQQHRCHQQEEEQQEPVLKRSRVEHVPPTLALSKAAVSSAFLREAAVEGGDSDDLFCEDAEVVVASSACRGRDTAHMGDQWEGSTEHMALVSSSSSSAGAGEGCASIEDSERAEKRLNNDGAAFPAEILLEGTTGVVGRLAPAQPKAVWVAAEADEDQGAEGWVTALRGSERAVAVQNHRRRLHNSSLSSAEGGENSDDESDRQHSAAALQPAEAVERGTLLCTFSPSEFYGRVTLLNTAESVRPAASSVRNVKVFRKNAVRCVGAGQALSFTAMQMVLPKESEREIQLRLELEARREREVYADHMMSDKFAVGAIRKKL